MIPKQVKKYCLNKTPIFPSDYDKELQGAGPVKTYTMSKEEIEKRYGNIENPKEKIPINLNLRRKKGEENVVSESVEKLKLTKELLEEYCKKFGVEKFNKEQIEQIAQETGNVKRIVAVHASRAGFYESQNKPKKEVNNNSAEENLDKAKETAEESNSELIKKFLTKTAELQIQNKNLSTELNLLAKKHEQLKTEHESLTKLVNMLDEKIERIEELVVLHKHQVGNYVTGKGVIIREIQLSEN